MSELNVDQATATITSHVTGDTGNVDDRSVKSANSNNLSSTINTSQDSGSAISSTKELDKRDGISLGDDQSTSAAKPEAQVAAAAPQGTGNTAAAEKTQIAEQTGEAQKSNAAETTQASAKPAASAELKSHTISIAGKTGLVSTAKEETFQTIQNIIKGTPIQPMKSSDSLMEFLSAKDTNDPCFRAFCAFQASRAQSLSYMYDNMGATGDLATRRAHTLPDGARISGARYCVDINKAYNDMLNKFSTHTKEINATDPNYSAYTRERENALMDPERNTDFKNFCESKATPGRRILDFFSRAFGTNGHRERAKKDKDEYFSDTKRTTFYNEYNKLHTQKFIEELQTSILNKTLEIYGHEDYRIISFEQCSGDNNSSGLRGMTLFAPGPILTPLLQSNSVITKESIKSFADRFGGNGNLLDRMAETYAMASGSMSDREKFIAAYEEYYEAYRPGEICPNLREKVFTGELRDIIERCPKDGGNLVPDEASENAFNAYVAKHRVIDDDGGVTIDLGHIKFMAYSEVENHFSLKFLAHL
jgi:hypothetical protein